jgi:hypothetical protein
VSRASYQSVDLPTLIADKSRPKDDKDVLEEFRYSQWQDMSPDALTCFDFLEKAGTAKFLKVNIYKLFDLSTIA